MRAITRTCSPALIHAGGHRFWVDSPDVGQALLLMDLMRGEQAVRLASDPKTEQAARLRRVCREWWDLRLASLLAQKGAERQAIEVASTLIFQRTRQEREALAETHSGKEGDPKEIDWPGVLSDYMATYSCTTRDVLAEPWDGFLLLSAKIHRQRAQKQLDYIHAKGMPHIKDDRERRQAMDALQKRAGVAPTEEKPMTDEEQFAKIDSVMAQMGVA